MTRPYLGRVDQYRTTGERIGSTITNEKGLYIYSQGQKGYFLADAGRHLPPADFRPLEALRFGEELGVVERVRTERVIGRPCVTGRTRDAAGVGAGMRRAEGGEVEDLCVDGTGIVLREATYLGGVRARLVTVTQLDLDLDLPAAIFDPSPVVESPEIPGSVSAEVPVSEITGTAYYRLDPASGFRLDGASARATALQAGSASTVVSTAYSRGADLVELLQQRGGEAPWPPDGTPTVSALGEARLASGLLGNELRIRVSEGGGADLYLRVRSLIAPGELQQLARHVRLAG